MLTRIQLLLSVIFMLCIGISAQTKLLRSPDIHGDRVIFTYGGDLWTTSAEGGTANRLTAHPGVETYAKFSPDGKWIAFTGQYDGGAVNVPEFALANLKGEYVIEGYGVDPDIEVENDPKSVIAGRDPQLERAVEEVMKKLTKPVKLPKRQADPIKNN